MEIACWMEGSIFFGSEVWKKTLTLLLLQHFNRKRLDQTPP
jgi:hypothetical protein